MAPVECRLLFGHDQLQIECSNDCPARLVQALAPDSPTSARDALWLLWKLTQSPRARLAVAEAGALSKLLRCLRPPLTLPALRVLCTLTFEPAVAVEASRAGGAGQLVKCLEAPEPECPETTSYALRTLGNLAAAAPPVAELGRAAGLAQLTDCLASRHLAVIRDALGLLEIVCRDRQSAELCARQAALRVAVRAHAESEDPETRRYAGAVLAMLPHSRVAEQGSRAVLGRRRRRLEADRVRQGSGGSVSREWPTSQPSQSRVPDARKALRLNRQAMERLEQENGRLKARVDELEQSSSRLGEGSRRELLQSENRRLREQHELLAERADQLALDNESLADRLRGQARPTSASVRSQSPGRPSPGRQSPGRQSPGRQSPGRQSPGRQSPGRQSPGRPEWQSPGQESPGRESPVRESPGRQSPGRQSPGRQSPGPQMSSSEAWVASLRSDVLEDRSAARVVTPLKRGSSASAESLASSVARISEQEVLVMNEIEALRDRLVALEDEKASLIADNSELARVAFVLKAESVNAHTAAAVQCDATTKLQSSHLHAMSEGCESVAELRAEFEALHSRHNELTVRHKGAQKVGRVLELQLSDLIQKHAQLQAVQDTTCMGLAEVIAEARQSDLKVAEMTRQNDAHGELQRQYCEQLKAVQQHVQELEAELLARGSSSRPRTPSPAPRGLSDSQLSMRLQHIISKAAATLLPSVEGLQPPGRLSPGRQSPGRQSPGRQSPGRQSPGRQSPGRQSPGWQRPEWQSPGWQSPGPQDIQLVRRIKSATAEADVDRIRALTPAIVNCSTDDDGDHGMTIIQDLFCALGMQDTAGGESRHEFDREVLQILNTVVKRPAQTAALAECHLAIECLTQLTANPSHDTKLLATRLLCRLSTEPSVRAAVRAKDAIPLLLLNLVHWPDQKGAALALATMRLFVNLSVSNKNKQSIAQAAGVSLVLEQLRSSHDELRQASIRVLSNLAADKVVRAELEQQGGFRACVSSLEKFQSKLDTIGTKYAIKTLGLLTTSFPEVAVKNNIRKVMHAAIKRMIDKDGGWSWCDALESARNEALNVLKRIQGIEE